MVITSLAMIALLVVAFLSMASTERRASNAYADGVTVRTLADSATNVVIGQIREATERLGSTKTWASQPGAIRTYGIDGNKEGRTNLENVYKLYSSDSMIASGDFDPNNELPSPDWAMKPAVYTDLNEPVATIPAPGSPSKLQFPILSPPAEGEVEGFEIEDAPGATPTQSAPMPVKWLYQLKDGRLVAPTQETSEELAFDPEVVTLENPIIGRVAFWTDDETAKVNINTASEGVFWDQPLGNTRVERGNAQSIADAASGQLGYASSIPLRNEFSRYPGHPARTSLSAIFGKWLKLGATPTAAELDNYYKLTPRVALGGSRGGTVRNDVSQIPLLDDDRLYASVDEMFFGTTLTGKLGFADAARRVNHNALTSEVFEKTKFFLTANSRAPEVNLFNKPRISLWPLMRNPAARNAVDRVIAFASTTGKGASEKPYYFQRYEASTGQGHQGSAFSPTDDYSKLPRNQELFSYLTKLTENPIPGFGGSFSAKYPNDRDQLLVKIFDYERSMVNLVSNALEPKYSFIQTNNAGLNDGTSFSEGNVVPLKIGEHLGFGRFVTLTEAALVFVGLDNDGDPKNAISDGLRTNPEGYATKMQAFLLLGFVHTSPGFPHNTPGFRVKIDGLNALRLNDAPVPFPSLGITRVGCAIGGIGAGHSEAFLNPLYPLHFDWNTPKTKGTANEKSNYPFVSNEFTLPGAPEATMSVGTDVALNVEIRTGEGASPGVLLQSFSLRFPGNQAWPRPRLKTTTARNFDQRVAAANSTAPNYSVSPLLQPKMSEAWAISGKDFRRSLIDSEDVVRSVQVSPTGPAKGDYRLIAGRTNVPSNYFEPHPNYGSSDWRDRGAHSLREDRWGVIGQMGYNGRLDTPSSELGPGVNDPSRPSTWSTGGALVQNVKYSPHTVPAVPRGLNGALNANGRPGDWENSVGILPDGGFIRAPNRTSSNTSYAKYDSGFYVWGKNYADSSTDGKNYVPNLQLASAVMFGALPTGVMSEQPWQTLLFSPNPPSRTTAALSAPTISDHKGFGSPRDHLLLDFFWMPVAEPYAISEPFSTAGKVNMNYDILPFRYIKRRTALHAVLKDARITAIPPSLAADQNAGRIDNYKGYDTSPYDFRYKVNLDEETGTLRGFEERFKSGDIFRSASEICDIFLVPSPLPGARYATSGTLPTYEQMTGWWAQMSLSGDNARENPYNDIYPRLTTKSDTFRVHLRVQTLRQPRGKPVHQWDETHGQVTGEYRGSVLLERHVDANDLKLPDFATASDFAKTSLDQHYKFRVVDRKQFAP